MSTIGAGGDEGKKKELSPQEKRAEKRKNIIGEMLTTEETYLSGLSSIIKNSDLIQYVTNNSLASLSETERNNLGILAKEQKTNVKAYTKALKDVTQEQKQTIDRMLKLTKEIHDCHLELNGKFKEFSDAIKNGNTNAALIAVSAIKSMSDKSKELSAQYNAEYKGKFAPILNTKLITIIDRLWSKSNPGVKSFSTLAVTPVQRWPRYVSLLEVLKNNIEPNDLELLRAIDDLHRYFDNGANTIDKSISEEGIESEEEMRQKYKQSLAEDGQPKSSPGLFKRASLNLSGLLSRSKERRDSKNLSKSAPSLTSSRSSDVESSSPVMSRSSTSTTGPISAAKSKAPEALREVQNKKKRQKPLTTQWQRSDKLLEKSPAPAATERQRSRANTQENLPQSSIEKRTPALGNENPNIKMVTDWHGGPDVPDKTSSKPRNK